MFNYHASGNNRDSFHWWRQMEMYTGTKLSKICRSGLKIVAASEQVFPITAALRTQTSKNSRQESAAVMNVIVFFSFLHSDHFGEKT